ncbi:hypothetical protein [Comamonas sp. C24C]
MEYEEVKSSLQMAIARSMSSYKKAQHSVALAIYVVPTALAVTAAVTIVTSWLLGEEIRLNKSAITMYGLLALLYAGYIARCYFEAKERVSELCDLCVSAKSLGFKVVHRPVDSGVVQDGLRVVDKAHPNSAIKARWGRWDALAAFVD